MKTSIKRISTSKETFYHALQEFSKEFQDYMKQHPEHMEKFIKAWRSGDDRVLLGFLREFMSVPAFSSVTRSLQMKTIISMSAKETLKLKSNKVFGVYIVGSQFDPGEPEQLDFTAEFNNRGVTIFQVPSLTRKITMGGMGNNCYLVTALDKTTLKAAVDEMLKINQIEDKYTIVTITLPALPNDVVSLS